MRTWREHSVDIMRTHWELTKNTLGTRGKWKIPPSPSLPANPKNTLGPCWAFSWVVHAIFIFKIVGHIFWHGLLAAAKKLWYTQILAHILGCTYCDLHQLDWIASNVQIFFLAMSQFDWLCPPPKKLNLWRLSHIEGSIFKLSVPSLWLTYIAERRTTFAKAYGIKVGCYWEHIGNKRKNETRNFFK